jgi:hypothetical protein
LLFFFFFSGQIILKLKLINIQEKNKTPSLTCLSDIYIYIYIYLFTYAFFLFFSFLCLLQVLQWKMQDVQVIVADLYPKGPFWDMFSRVFTNSKFPPLNAWDIKQKYSALPPSTKVCYRQLAFGIYGPASPITVASWRTPCFHTPLVRAYSDYVIR